MLMMLQIRCVQAWLVTRVAAARAHERQDRGASIVETVVIIGLFVAAAIVIVGILVQKATDAANNVKTQ